jgi:hypothetical protein
MVLLRLLGGVIEGVRESGEKQMRGGESSGEGLGVLF